MTLSPLLLSLEQAAENLAISRAKIKLLVADGTIPSVKVGRRRLITAAALERYVASLEEEYPPATGTGAR